MEKDVLPKRTILAVWVSCVLLSIPLPLIVSNMKIDCDACFYLFMFLEFPGAVAMLFGMGGAHGGDHIQMIVGGTLGVLVNGAFYSLIILHFMRRAARKRAAQSLE